MNSSRFYPAHKIAEMYTLIDRFEELIIEAVEEDRLREYVVDFLSEDNKKYHNGITIKFFRQQNFNR